MAVSYEQVEEAARAIIERGDAVTARAVRVITGGSMRDVAPLVKRFADERVEAEAAAAKIDEIPGEILELLNRVAAKTWMIACNHASAEAAELRRRLTADARAHEEAMADAEALRIELETELEEKSKALADAEAKCAQAREKHQALEIAYARVDERCKAAAERMRALEPELRRRDALRRTGKAREGADAT